MATLKGLRKERAHSSPRYRDGKFHNTSGVRPDLVPGERGMLGIAGEFFCGGKRRAPAGPLPVERPHEAWTRRVSSGMRVTWLGHSTVLLEVDGRRVLTDPVFGDRASPVSFAGAFRWHPVPAKLCELPPLDAVLLSHDHYDHLCATTARELAAMGVPIVTSLGVGAHLERLGVDSKNVTELDWWEEATVGGVSFTATPSQHFSGRGLGDRNDTLWSSWVLSTENRRLFFSGDTGLTDEFRDVHARFGAFDLVMLEIGAFHPAWGKIHLGPDNALRAFDMLGGGTLLPVHWGTFDLALHPWDEPAERLFQLAGETGTRILTPRLGRPFEPDHVDAPEAWWREVARVPSATITSQVPG